MTTDIILDKQQRNSRQNTMWLKNDDSWHNMVFWRRQKITRFNNSWHSTSWTNVRQEG